MSAPKRDPGFNLFSVRTPQADADLAAADAAWQYQIGKIFGDDRIDRYAARPEGQGEPGTPLRYAYEIRMTALATWHVESGKTLRKVAHADVRFT